MSTYSIGQVAERTGFSASTLRYYEELGLLVPATRTDAGYRRYDDEALGRLAFIARAKQLGCSLDEITDLLRVWDGDECGAVQRRFHELVTEKIRATQDQVAELLAFTAQLRMAAARLDSPPIDGPCEAACACFASVGVGECEPPVMCSLPPDAVPARVEEWNELLRHVRARSELGGGRLRLEFDDAIDVAELASVVALEQQCCRFFTFALTIDARGVALEVDAPEAASDDVRALFATAR
jgi:MerR family transcriptional regulator, copper efflux regulator